MRGLNRYLVVTLALIMLAGLAVTGCRPTDTGAPTDDVGPVQGGIVFDGGIGDCQTFNPLYTADTSSSRITHFLHEALVRWNRDVELVPELAHSWDMSACETEYIFYLREGVKWHDGHPFTAKDVKFTFEAFMHPFYTGPRRGDMKPLLGWPENTARLNELRAQLREETITDAEFDELALEAYEAWKQLGALTVINDHTIKFKLAEPFGTFMTQTAAYKVVPEHILGGVCGRDVPAHDFTRNPIGTGPFKFVEWKTGEHVVIERNEDWWGGYDDSPLANVDQFVYKVIPDAATLEIALEAKELDVGAVQPESFDHFATLPHLRIYESPIFSYTYMGFRLLNPLFQDLAVRQAIAHAIDRQQIVDELYMGHGTIAHTHGSPARWDYNPNVTTYGYNPDKSKQLLADAGWTPGPDGILVNDDGLRFSFTLQTNQGNKIREVAAVVIQQQLLEIGMEVEVQYVEWATFVSDVLLGHNFEVIIVGWSLGVDPDAYTIWHTDGGVYNFGPYSNARVDEILEEAARLSCLDARRELYMEKQAILAKELPYVFLFYPNSITAVGNRCQGDIRPTALDRGPLFNLHQWWIPTEMQAGPHLN